MPRAPTLWDRQIAARRKEHGTTGGWTTPGIRTIEGGGGGGGTRLYPGEAMMPRAPPQAPPQAPPLPPIPEQGQVKRALIPSPPQGLSFEETQTAQQQPGTAQQQPGVTGLPGPLQPLGPPPVNQQGDTLLQSVFGGGPGESEESQATRRALGQAVGQFATANVGKVVDSLVHLQAVGKLLKGFGRTGESLLTGDTTIKVAKNTAESKLTAKVLQKIGNSINPLKTAIFMGMSVVGTTVGVLYADHFAKSQKFNDLGDIMQAITIAKGDAYDMGDKKSIEEFTELSDEVKMLSDELNSEDNNIIDNLKNVYKSGKAKTDALYEASLISGRLRARQMIKKEETAASGEAFLTQAQGMSDQEIVDDEGMKAFAADPDSWASPFVKIYNQAVARLQAGKASAAAEAEKAADPRSPFPTYDPETGISTPSEAELAKRAEQAAYYASTGGGGGGGGGSSGYMASPSTLNFGLLQTGPEFIPGKGAAAGAGAAIVPQGPVVDKGRPLEGQQEYDDARRAREDDYVTGQRGLYRTPDGRTFVDVAGAVAAGYDPNELTFFVG